MFLFGGDIRRFTCDECKCVPPPIDLVLGRVELAVVTVEIVVTAVPVDRIVVVAMFDQKK